MSKEKRSIDEITEMLAAPALVSFAPLGGQCAGNLGVPGQDHEEEHGVLMAIDDINRQLNYFDQLSHSLKMSGKDAEAQEVKEMANAERKNKVRLRDILKVLQGND